MNLLFITLDFFVWWYTKGIILFFRNFVALLNYLMGMFSVKESIFNLFSPWKRLVSQRRPGLDGFRDFIIDNLVSRGVGFVMRVILLIMFFAVTGLYLGLTVVFAIIWLGWPILIPFFIITGATNA
jgi:hypothetical protein